MRAMFLSGVALALVATFLILTPSVGYAGTVDPIGYDHSGLGVRVSGPTGSATTSAGQFVWTVGAGGTDTNFPAGSTFVAYCIELQDYANGNLWTTYYDSAIDTAAPSDNTGGLNLGFTANQAMGTAARQALAELVHSAWGSHALSSSVADRAAFQIAVWEIVHEGIEVSTTYNVGSGNISFSNINASVLTEAQSLITNRGTVGASIVAFVANNNQDMVTVVPLPPAAFLGLGMLGVMGIARLRRRRLAE